VIDRRTFVRLVPIGLAMKSLRANAQQAGKIYRIGYLAGGSPAGSLAFVEQFREGLREHGWIEGHNVVIEYRFAEGSFDRLPALAADLVRLKVDLIAAIPTPAAVAAKNATGTIPIVVMAAVNPLELGLIASVARPGGNLTGIAFSFSTEILGKNLTLLKEAIPTVRHVAVLSNAGNPGHAVAIKNVKAAADVIGVQLSLLEVREPNEFDAAFKAMVDGRSEAVLVIADAQFQINRARLAELAAKNRLPSMHGFKEYVEAGGLMSYGPSIAASVRRGASFVDRILRGAKPADVPVEQPTKFDLVINMKTARALGLTIPQPLLLRADEVIQ
jgi:putative ABC transport system substrate-binding protein